MIKYATVIYLILISGKLAAQTSTLAIKQLPANILTGVSYIPTKSFTAFSYTGSDSLAFYIPKTVSTNSFYISQYEVSNKAYREFVWYARNAAAHTLLQHFKKGSKEIDWSRRINWNDPLLESMLVSPDNRIFGKKEINTNLIMYGAASSAEMIPVYPDTLVWIRDFSYSYNEPLAKHYFSNKKYDNYPVVGINLKQAMAFCDWKEAQVNKLLEQAGSAYRVIVRLPVNIEWEAAAIDDENKIYSPGKKYTSNFGTILDKNGFIVKKYDEDGYFYCGPVNSYPPNVYGLNNMKGNVAEWTSDTAGTIIAGKKSIAGMDQSFIVKGGGWDSNPFYLQTGVCQFFPAEAAHAFLGFRYVVYITKK